jgi:nitronate monooxygenase
VLRTRFAEKYGLRYPIAGAPMATASSSSLAAGVTKAGGLGTFGGISAEGPDWVREHIRAVRAQTDGPFAVGFITAFIPGFETNFQVALDEKVPLIMLSFGDPRPYAERARAVGVPVACQVQTLESARWALEAEAEFIVAQGTEAGGHGGYLSTLPCLSMVLGIAGETPVLASGGIASGRSLAAILAAGAEGAMLGTTLLATPESTDVSEEYKNHIVASDGEDTVFSTAWDIVSGAPWPEGIAVRTRRDSLVDEWRGREEDLRERVDQVRARVQEDGLAPISMGQSAGFVNAVRPAAEVIASICDEAEAVLRRRSQDLGL